MEYIFKCTQYGVEILWYVEGHDDMLSLCGCSCVDYDRFVSYNIIWRGWQSGVKKYSYVEPYEYMEMYDGAWSILVCSFVGCDVLFSYNISWKVLQAGLNWIP